MNGITAKLDSYLNDARRLMLHPCSAQFPRELGIAARHEGGRFFVADLDKANLLLAFSQRLHDAVDAIARQRDKVLLWTQALPLSSGSS